MISNIIRAIWAVAILAFGTLMLWLAWAAPSGAALFLGLISSFVGLSLISSFVGLTGISAKDNGFWLQHQFWPFDTASSYKAEDLQVEDNGFRLQHRFWPFDNIRQVKCNYVVTRHKRQLVIELAIDGEKRPKRIYADPVLRRLSDLWRHRQDLGSADLLFKYERICNGSFETRCAHYVDEIKRNGSFTYDRKQFHLDGDVVYRDGLANLRMEVITRGPFTFNVGTRWDRRISTQVDADVFYWLLERLFGISFGAGATPPPAWVTPRLPVMAESPFASLRSYLAGSRVEHDLDHQRYSALIALGLPGIPMEGDLNFLMNNDDEEGRRFFDSKFGAGAAERFLKAKANRGRTYR